MVSGVAGPNAAALSSYLFLWGLFSLFMFAGTLRLNGSLMFVFGTLFILFFLLAANAPAILGTGGNANLLKLTGYEGVICGLGAIYASAANILNEVYRKTVLPMFPVKPRN